MDKTEIKKKIMEEEDYVRCPKCGNSLSKFLLKNDEGAKDSVIAKMLMISEEEVDTLYEEAIQMLKDDMIGDE